MNPASYRLRRATVDDFPTLRALWESMKFPVPELERRLTEFQVAENGEGRVIGGVGFEIVQRHGRIHSEAYADFSVADVVRPLIWTRLQSLSMNHGVLRLWTQEQSPFWSGNGLVPADPAGLEKLPENWRALGGTWLTLKLKDEEAVASMDKEFALFMESEKARSSQALEQARKLKTVATVIAFAVALGVFGAAFYMFLSRRQASGDIPPAPTTENPATVSPP